MKTKLLFLICLLMCLAACSTSESFDSHEERIFPKRSVALSPEFQFTMDQETQDDIAYCIANACTDYAFVNGLQNYIDTIHSSPYMDVIFSADEDDDLTEQGRSIMECCSELSDLIYGVCAANYLRLNLYIPNSAEVLQSYNGHDDIYIVNALYHEALDVVDDSLGIYRTAYIVSNGIAYEMHEQIDESFANQHLTIVLSFRDEIVNWLHFSKGSQSYSDLLLRNAISFVGFGCATEEEVDYALTTYYGSGDCGLKFEIQYGKRVNGVCDDSSNRFCGLKLVRHLNDIPWTSYTEYDPSHTGWMLMDYDQSLQKVYIEDNPLSLDLNGYDFFLNEMTIEDGDISILIPQQICYYSEEHNALCFNIIML